MPTDIENASVEVLCREYLAGSKNWKHVLSLLADRLQSRAHPDSEAFQRVAFTEIQRDAPGHHRWLVEATTRLAQDPEARLGPEPSLKEWDELSLAELIDVWDPPCEGADVYPQIETLLAIRDRLREQGISGFDVEAAVTAGAWSWSREDLRKYLAQWVDLT